MQDDIIYDIIYYKYERDSGSESHAVRLRRCAGCAARILGSGTVCYCAFQVLWSLERFGLWGLRFQGFRA